MPGKGQYRVAVVVNGPDPAGCAAWDSLANRTALELSPFGAPLCVRAGMKGEPGLTWYGDAGPLGGLPALNYGARRAAYPMDRSQALPSTNLPAGAGGSGVRDMLAGMGY
jgi:hypothetical protein